MTTKTFKTTYDENLKTWSGIKEPRKYPANYSVGRAALEAMQRNAKKIAQVCYHNGKEYTYEEIGILTKSVAQHFTDIGLKQGDVIGICATNSDFLAPLFFGALLKGIIASTLDVVYEKDNIKHVFSISKPKMIFCDGAVYEKVKAAIDESGFETKIYTMINHIKGIPEITEFLMHNNNELNIEPLEIDGSSTAVIICSSGTTGLPKGVTASHEDFLCASFLELEPTDRLLSFSLIHWYTGLYSLIWGTLKGLTRYITQNGYTPNVMFDIVEKYKITIVLTAPSHLAMALEATNLKTVDLSSVRLYCVAGSAASYSVVKRFKPLFPNAVFQNAYGMSEARSAAATGEMVDKIGRIGQLSANFTYKVIDDNGQNLGPNQIGELYFTNPFKWRGYYDNPKATEATLDANGWIRTGDVGYFDDEGFLFVVDRKKDILKSKGYHYFPTEIENVIYELPNVVESCVCGINDLVAGDLPAAVVVKQTGSNLTEAEIYEHVAKRLESFKNLNGGVYFLEKLPKTGTGKPLRSAVQKICEALRKEKTIN